MIGVKDVFEGKGEYGKNEDDEKKENRVGSHADDQLTDSVGVREPLFD